jgi:hypothetical protein
VDPTPFLKLCARAGLVPATPLNKARPCHMIGVAGNKPGDDQS